MRSENVKNTKREVNLDLLRIFSMFLIVLLHSIDHSGVLENAPLTGGAINAYVAYMYAFTRVCVNCFVLLSGYFLVKSKFRLQKLAVLWMEVVFYSLVIRVIFMATGQVPFSITGLISCLVPVFTGRYWFITIYFALYLLSPFLNLAIRAMNKFQHTVLNIALFLIFSVWISVHPSVSGPNSGGGWGLAWFVVLYFAAGWFRLYYTPNRKAWLYLLLFIVFPLFSTAAYVFFGELGVMMQPLWCRYDAVPVYLASIALFVAFLNIKIEVTWLKRLILWASPLTFGVYLIHAHANVDPWLWGMLDLSSQMQHWYFPILQLTAVVLIFVVCLLLDWIRKITVGRIERSRWITKVCEQSSDFLVFVGRKLIEREHE